MVTAYVEPWLRGTLGDVHPIQRQVLHALELTRDDCIRWCARLSDAEVNARPYGLEPVGFHLRHIARSLDRLLSYAEGRELDAAQLSALRTELAAGAVAGDVVAELVTALQSAGGRIRAFAPSQYNEWRMVGRAHLPTTVAGLLIHCAEHTQRHTGQAVTTAKLVLALREGQVIPT